jgi:hypothetical protein
MNAAHETNATGQAEPAGQTRPARQLTSISIRIAASKDTPIAWLTTAAKLAAEHMVNMRYGVKGYYVCGERFKALWGELFSGRGEIELCVGRVKDNEHAHLLGNYLTDGKYNIVDAVIYLVRT